MTSEQWEELFNELYDLQREFLDKYRKKDFRYMTQRNQNDNRVSMIVDITARKILHTPELKEHILKDETEDGKEYMLQTGLWVKSKYWSTSTTILDFIESKIDN